MEALIFTADGDMRQAINNMQATHAGFGQVSDEDVFKVKKQNKSKQKQNKNKTNQNKTKPAQTNKQSKPSKSTNQKTKQNKTQHKRSVINHIHYWLNQC